MENNPQTAVQTAQQAGMTATNQFERMIATLKRDRDGIIDDLNMNKESVYKRYRAAIMQQRDNALDYYSEGRNVVGIMLHHFFDAHPEIREIWNAEKDSLWHQVQEGGVQ